MKTRKKQFAFSPGSLSSKPRTEDYGSYISNLIDYIVDYSWMTLELKVEICDDMGTIFIDTDDGRLYLTPNWSHDNSISIDLINENGKVIFSKSVPVSWSYHFQTDFQLWKSISINEIKRRIEK
tara:strand:+ start:1961 stop:2332 length:372 start_codon:yes stop_codon:yes gene_type:complete